ncbi:MAG TPA: hypothetical protein VMV68_04745 [Spirochaetia bacterium]|nr:hypothetical protein [Spirochaetia bacterium]
MKIQELTQKIYQDGVEKAKQEEKLILDGARTQAEELLETARTEAERIVQTAKSEAEETKRRLAAETDLAANQVLSTLKQRVTDLLTDASLGPVVHEAVNDKEFIEGLIRSIAEKWDTSQMSIDLSIVLPEKDKAHFDEFFKRRAADLLSKGIEIKFQGRMSGGFVVGPKDDAFKLSFGEKEFSELFKSFLRQRTADILFPGKKG